MNGFDEIVLWLKSDNPKGFKRRYKKILSVVENEIWNCQLGIGHGFLTCYEYEIKLLDILRRIYAIKGTTK